MNTEERRQKILETLLHSKIPLTGAMLSHKFQVSRQIIVGDITIQRATGHNIYATPRSNNKKKKQKKKKKKKKNNKQQGQRQKRI